MSPRLKTLNRRLAEVQTRDRFRLSRSLRKIDERAASSHLSESELSKLIQQLERQFERSIAQVEVRKQLATRVDIPPKLPIAGQAMDILKLLDTNQVLIVAGETGSGKTTQLPKLCLQSGRGSRGVIGHTQPRRVAARSVAARIAEELGSELGEEVGYQIRFGDQTSDATQIKVMTDGVLLSELQRDRFLSRYDTIIIDEAHERSLNIDFLLGCLKQLLPRRLDLKLIITSATIDVQRFSSHFDGAPIVEISGRTYPVEIKYLPDEKSDLSDAVCDCVSEIYQSGYPKGDTLVFLPGEREIREVALQLRKLAIPGLEVLPLYSRLSIAEQNWVFHKHRGVRVVLATNVAETSLTVPGIRFVIDPGIARISRYSTRTKVQRLPVEPISQASANQRAGRCGRIADGICFRLYSEEDFLSRPEFTDPEIHRTNLAAVILQMLSMRLGDIEKFPFIEPPEAKQLRDGLALLGELQLIDSGRKLTASGKIASHIPVDPRLAKILYEGQRTGCLRELLIIVSALAIQDPRERPHDKQTQADQAHAKLCCTSHPEIPSDFMDWVNLWNLFEEKRQELSNRKLRDWCQTNFLNWLRMREWRDIHRQLSLALRDLRWKPNSTQAGYDTIHQAILTGYLTNIGVRDRETGEYTGPNNRKFVIFPGSNLRKKPPKWLLSAGLIETSRLYAHSNAVIRPEWIVKAAKHLTRTEYHSPRYDHGRGQVVAREKVLLRGLVISNGRKVNYSRIDPQTCHAIFVHEALAGEKYSGRGEFFKHNQSVLNELREHEEKTRRRDLSTDQSQLDRFYRSRVDSRVVDLKSFERWRYEIEKSDPKQLFLNLDDLKPDQELSGQFPDSLNWDGVEYRVTYRFEPGHVADGVQIGVPIELLHQVPGHCADWLVPGLLEEKCVALLKSLPKQFRRQLVPIPDTVTKLLPVLQSGNQPLVEQLGQAIQKLKAVHIPRDAWNPDEIEPLYRIYFRLLDSRGKEIDGGRDLSQLRARYRSRAAEALKSELDDVQSTEQLEREDIREWDFGELNDSLELVRQGTPIKVWPGLQDAGSSVRLKLFDNPYEAEVSSLQGVARLLLIRLKQQADFVRKDLFRGEELLLFKLGFKDQKIFADQLLVAVARSFLLKHGVPGSSSEFEQRADSLRPKIVTLAGALESSLKDCIDLRTEIAQALEGLHPTTHANIRGDIEAQIERYFQDGFLSSPLAEMVPEYPRFLRAIQKRLDRLQGGYDRDIESLGLFRERQQKMAELLRSVPFGYELMLPEYRQLLASLEEWRISLFAQPMKTRFKVSTKVVDQHLSQLAERARELATI